MQSLSSRLDRRVVQLLLLAGATRNVTVLAADLPQLVLYQVLFVILPVNIVLRVADVEGIQMDLTNKPLVDEVIRAG